MFSSYWCRNTDMQCCLKILTRKQHFWYLEIILLNLRLLSIGIILFYKVDSIGRIQRGVVSGNRYNFNIGFQSYWKNSIAFKFANLRCAKSIVVAEFEKTIVLKPYLVQYWFIYIDIWSWMLKHVRHSILIYNLYCIYLFIKYTIYNNWNR